ncbi:phosphoenolpyruvate carboxylase kinase 2 isoform X1 [Solanum tuberosum]|uniref:phosphoenolpyruvate carboxylase kinase 2 isoform X1 n=1 Tax=Solanum tuberosum TaxID=4113 RepID=UPI00073A1074|nr:PREDICTED: phosphoenolpyruvate carboxylase kinase 2 isoform X1 [Solanum tuberosum]
MFESLKTDELQMNEQIGQGRFGTVYRCFSKSTDQFFACKTIQKNLLIDSTDRQCLDKEPKILQLLTGKSNILQMYKVYEDENYVHIVTELCSGGDLYKRVSNGPLSEKSASLILIRLVSAIGHCHKLGVAHRDIKPDNVLFDSQDDLKLADFGSAEWFMGCDGKMMEGVVGTPYYVAPEVLLGRKYNEKVDIWSAGVILYIMLSGVPPFYGDTPTETFEAVLRGNLRFPTRIFRSISTEAKDLLRKMICKDVSRRFSAEQVLRHPWIINVGEINNING